jgi:hypothetical protein
MYSVSCRKIAPREDCAANLTSFAVYRWRFFFPIQMDKDSWSALSSRGGYLSIPRAVEEDLDFFWRQAIVGVLGFRATANRGEWSETNDAQVV